MEQSMTDMPRFLLNVRLDEGSEPYVLSCSIVGQPVGVRGVVRRFKSKDQLLEELKLAKMEPRRYNGAMSNIDTDPGKTRSFPINLNEAQLLSVIQTDSTE